MPITVITVSNAPPSLKGDLTKWMQEIAVGVYVGNFNVKVREELWKRVKDTIGKGQATLSYGYRNELGYRFETHQTDRQSIDFDGIQLVYSPIKETVYDNITTKGFSDASKFRRSRKFSSQSGNHCQGKSFVVLDIETDGLDYTHNHIIEIGAILIRGTNHETFHTLINTGKPLSQSIIKLTGITDEMLLNEGVTISEALNSFVDFIGTLPIIGYSVDFDLSFINVALQRLGYLQITNKRFDLLTYIKKNNMFLKNYKLSNVLSKYDVEGEVFHRALLDAQLIYELATKVNGFIDKMDIVG